MVHIHQLIRFHLGSFLNMLKRSCKIGLRNVSTGLIACKHGTFTEFLQITEQDGLAFHKIQPPTEDPLISLTCKVALIGHCSKLQSISNRCKSAFTKRHRLSQWVLSAFCTFSNWPNLFYFLLHRIIFLSVGVTDPV